MTEEEKEKIPAALDEASDWMFDLEGEPGAEVGFTIDAAI